MKLIQLSTRVRTPRIGKRALGILALALLASSAVADDIVYVTARPTPSGAGNNPATNPDTAAKLYNDGTYGGDTSAKSTVADAPLRSGCRYFSTSFSNSTPALGVTLSPHLNVPGGIYVVQHTYSSSAGNCSPTIVVAVTNTANCTLSWTNTDRFQSTFGNSTWQTLGYLTNTPGSPDPQLTFYFAGGDVSAGAQKRLEMDCFKFVQLNQCLEVNPPGVTGPLATNVTAVRVTGVLSNATTVKVYQLFGGATNVIGSTNLVNPDPTVDVNVSGLIKGAIVGASQIVGAVESCTPKSGILVGGGANPRLRLAASIRQTKTVTGPIGRNYGPAPASDIYWIGATGSAVAGGLVLQPSTNWQTVVFYPWDAHYLWNDNSDGLTFPDPNQFGILEGLSFAIDDPTDTGPMNIYLDNLRNADVLIQDFENQTNGTPVPLFNQPSFSGTTAGNLLASPNGSQIAQDNRASGTNSAQILWQWAATNSSVWLRLNTSSNATAATPNPVVDLTQPIAIDVLVLPVGQTAGHSLGLIMTLTNQTVCPGASATFALSASPAPATGPYSYQWQLNGSNIAGATASSFTTNAVSTASSGIYSCLISDGAASAVMSSKLTVLPVATIDLQPIETTVNLGDPAFFAITASPVAPCSSTLNYQWRLYGTNVPGATSSSLSIASTKMSDAGVYTCVVTNQFGSVTSAAVWLHVLEPNPAYGNGTGLLGLYYSNSLPATAFSGAPAWTNTDYYSINFDGIASMPSWGSNAPDAIANSPTLVGSNNFTARFVGKVQAKWAQSYNFYAKSDDGVRLWVDGRLILDGWKDQAATEYNGAISLTTNLTPIVLEYYEKTGDAILTLSWESASQAKEIVPMTQLYWDPTNYPGTPSTALTTPTNNASYPQTAIVELRAAVTANNNGIDLVQFLSGSTVIAQALNPPFTAWWTNPAPGAYTIFARAQYNNSSRQADSASAAVTVVAVTPPHIGGITYNTGNLQLSGTGPAGKNFILLSSPGLTVPVANWTRVATNSSGTGAFSFTIIPGADPQAFYNVKAE